MAYKRDYITTKRGKVILSMVSIPTDSELALRCQREGTIFRNVPGCVSYESWHGKKLTVGRFTLVIQVYTETDEIFSATARPNDGGRRKRVLVKVIGERSIVSA